MGYVEKDEASPLQKKFCDFCSKGLRFRILLTMDYETKYPQVFKSTFRYSGGFFLIRFKPHQEVFTIHRPRQFSRLLTTVNSHLMGKSQFHKKLIKL